MRPVVPLRVRAVLLSIACSLACAAAAASTLPGNLPLRKDPEASELGIWLPALLLLALVAIAGGIAVWQRGTGALVAAWRRPQREARAGASRLSSLALTPQASVHVVQWHGEELLVACTAQQVTVLSRRGGAAGAGESP